MQLSAAAEQRVMSQQQWTYHVVNAVISHYIMHILITVYLIR